MSPLDNVNTDSVMTELGQRPDSRRRLSDKILAAFNHAYAVGEIEVAKKLKVALSANEKKAGPLGDMRHGYDPLGEAELWVAFVEARNTYRATCDARKHDSRAVAEALEAMKEAYRIWSAS
jgi:hypothetical protein